MEKASSLKSEPLHKIRYRDDKINKKSITKKKAPCSIHTNINPCYKFFDLVYTFILWQAQRTLFIAVLWNWNDLWAFQTQGDIKVFTYWLFLLERGGGGGRNILVELPWRFSRQAITEKEWYEVFAWCISFWQLENVYVQI